MELQFTLYALPSSLAAILLSLLAIHSWKSRPATGAAWFTLFILAAAEMALANALWILAGDLSSKLFWDKVEYLGMVLVPVALLAFTLEYTGRVDRLTHRNFALALVVPAFVLLLAWTNEWHGLIYTRITFDPRGTVAVLDEAYGPGFWLLVLYSYLLLGTSVGLLVQALYHSPGLYRAQVGAVLAGVLVGLAANVLDLMGWGPIMNLDLAPSALVLTGLAVSWSLFRYKLLDLTPIARQVVMDGMADAAIVLNLQNRIVDLNLAAHRILGKTETQVLGQPVGTVLTACQGLEQYRELTNKQCQLALPEKEVLRYYDLAISLLHNRRGEPIGRLIVMRDITEHKQAEAALERHAQEMSSLVETTSDLAATQRDLPTLLQTITHRAIALLKGHGGGVYLYDPVQGDLRLVVETDPSIPVGRSLQLGEGLAGRVALTRQPLIVDDYRTWPARSEKYADTSLTALVQAPMLYGGELIGVLAVHEIGETGRKFTAEDARLLSLLAGQAASAVQNARLFDQAQRRLNETLLVNRVIAAASSALDPIAVLSTICQELAQTLNLPRAGFALFNPDRTHLTVVAEYCAPGKSSSLGAVIPLAGNQATQEAITLRTPVVVSQAQTDERQPALHELEKRLEVVSLLIVPLVGREQVIGTMGLVADEFHEFSAEEIALAEHIMTAASQAFENAQLYTQVQRELAERERYEFIVNTSHELMTLINQERRYKAVNAAYCQAHHKTRQEIVDKTLAEIWGAESYETNIKPHLDRSFAGEIVRYQAWFEFTAGEARCFDVTYYPYLGPNRQVTQVVVVSHDITELKRAEQLLQESEERFRRYFELGLIGMAITSPAKGMLEVNDRTCEILGYERSELLQMTWAEMTHPDDVAADVAQFNRVLAGEMEGYTLDKRWIRKDGQIIYTTISVKCVRGADGAVEYFVALMQDITERKQAEQALIASEQKYRTLFSEAQRQAQELALLGEVRSALMQDLELPVMLRTVVQAIAQSFGYTQVSLYMLRGGRLVLQHQVGYDHVIEEIPLTKGICGRALSSGQPVLLEDVRADPSFLGAIEGIMSEVCIPLFDQGKAVGVLNVESNHGVRLREADLRLMTQLGEYINIAVGQARLYAEVQCLAITDGLTGTFNRRHLFELGAEELSRARRLARPLSAIMLDIDHFKQVNDRYGHAIGDQVLRALAEHCRNKLREFDILARYGGEEFVVLLPNTGLDHAERIAERLRRCVAEMPISTRRDTISITLSLGVSTSTGNTPDLAALLDRADEAMYAAKQAGRNCVSVAALEWSP